ncbi:hypothetical protein ACH5RR_025726 [Cinchona calisaya]|uniref:DUF659 domain-containing protein n=1 Tax=Cinchona calisaya TaxID=153742 RepID=A0ABD2Z2T3_9GENT
MRKKLDWKREFKDVIPKEIPLAFHLDVIPKEIPLAFHLSRVLSSKLILSRLPLSQTNPPIETNEENSKQVEELMAQGRVREIMSLCAMQVILVPKHYASWHMFCNNPFAGGGIHRMKLHLAGEMVNVAPCTKEYAQKSKEKSADFWEQNSYGRSVNDFDGNDIQEIPPPLAKGVSINMVEASASQGKRKAMRGMTLILKNVVHMVTDNASNYKATGLKISERDPTICWSPYAAHRINLILKDIGELSDVKALVDLASTVTVFLYNHKFTLNWFWKSKGWKEIIHPGETGFATTFISLKSLYDWKENLQALVTSGDYKIFLKMVKGKKAKQIVLDDKPWNNCLILVRITGPLIRLLRVCDVDEKPSMGYV